MNYSITVHINNILHMHISDHKHKNSTVCVYRCRDPLYITVDECSSRSRAVWGTDTEVMVAVEC